MSKINLFWHEYQYVDILYFSSDTTSGDEEFMTTFDLTRCQYQGFAVQGLIECLRRYNRLKLFNPIIIIKSQALLACI